MQEVQIEEADFPTAKLIHIPEGEGSDFVLRFSTEGNQLSYEALHNLARKYQTDDLTHPDVISEEGASGRGESYEVLIGTSIGKRIQHKFRSEKDLLVLFHTGSSDALSAKVNCSNQGHFGSIEDL